MAKTYPSFKTALTGEQKKKLQKAFAETWAVTLLVYPEQIRRIDDLRLTSAQIKQMKNTLGKKRAKIGHKFVQTIF